MTRRILEIIGLLLAIGCGIYGFKNWQKERDIATRPATIRNTQALASPIEPKTEAAPTQVVAATVQLPTASAFPEKDNQAMLAIHAHFATGDFVTALKLADAALLDNSYSPAFHQWTLAQLPALLISAGWAKLKTGDCEAAITYLRRAETSKRTPDTAKGLAVCYYKEKNLMAASDQFAYYLERTPQDPEMSLLYADVLESNERYEDAVKILEPIVAQLESSGTSNEDFSKSVRQRLASLKARSKESVNQRIENSRNFRILYRAGDHEDLVVFVVTTLEDALDEYIERYQFQIPPGPLEVTLYPAGDFKDLVTGGPAWAEGLYDGRLRIPIKQSTLDSHNYTSLKIVLRHELVHALFGVMSDNRNMPSWFDEGLAQRLSCGVDGCGPFPFPPTPGTFLPPASFSTPYTALDSVQAGSAYRQSLYLIYQLERSKGDDALRQLVRGVGKATDITSDGVLSPLGLTFSKLHEDAASAWERRAYKNSRY